MKKCTRCHKSTVPEEDKRVTCEACRLRQKTLNQVRYYADPRKTRARRYGLTTDQLTQLWNIQRRRCPICNTRLTLRGRQTHTDHCHDTGEVRGLLCVSCNNGIGLLGESPEQLLAAVKYLRAPRPFPSPWVFDKLKATYSFGNYCVRRKRHRSIVRKQTK